MPETREHEARGRLFAEALESGAAVRAGTFAVGGRRLAVRCVGSAHWDQLTGSLLVGEGRTELALDVWDADEVGIDPPTVRWPRVAELRPGIHGEALGLLPGGRDLVYAGPDFDVRLEREHGRLAGWVAARRLPPWHRLRPWQSLLVPALADQGVETVHASMVARGGVGVLVPGANGAGKSTTAFACLSAGLDVLGDDAIGVELVDGSPLGHTVHAVAKLSATAIRGFPELAASAVRYDDPAEAECFVQLGRLEPPRTAASARIAAIAFPRLADSERSGVTRVRSAQAATELLRHTLSAEPARLAAVFDTAVRLASSVPAFTLSVGRDPRGLAAAVEGLLGHAA